MALRSQSDLSKLRGSDLMKKELIFGLSLALASTGAFAAEWGFNEWDGDGDGALTEEEFGAGFENAGLFNTWDENGDGVLAEDEWSNIGVDADYASWDENGDGALAEDEFETGLYNTWDDNADGVIGAEEWDDAGDEGWFDV